MLIGGYNSTKIRQAEALFLKILVYLLKIHILVKNSF